jgi:hypothetical protein
MKLNWEPLETIFSDGHTRQRLIDTAAEVLRRRLERNTELHRDLAANEKKLVEQSESIVKLREELAEAKKRAMELQNLRCEANTHAVSHADHELKECPHCFIDSSKDGRNALRAAVDLMIRSSSRAMMTTGDSEFVKSLNTIDKKAMDAFKNVCDSMLEITGVGKSVLVEEEDHYKKSREKFIKTKTEGGPLSWLTTMVAVGAIGAYAMMGLWKKAK